MACVFVSSFVRSCFFVSIFVSAYVIVLISVMVNVFFCVLLDVLVCVFVCAPDIISACFCFCDGPSAANEVTLSLSIPRATAGGPLRSARENNGKKQPHECVIMRR